MKSGCRPGTCVGCDSARQAVLIQRAKETLPMPEYDWEYLERSSDLARLHRFPDGRKWKETK